jgi:chromosomal replication initiator protein
VTQDIAALTALDAGRWDRVRERWRAEFGDAVFEPWFARLSFRLENGGEARLAAPTRFMGQWIERRYLPSLAAHLRAEFPDCGAVVVEGAEGAPAACENRAAADAAGAR